MTLTIEDVLARANARPIITAEVVAGLHLYHWTQDGTYTNCYYTACTLRVEGVNEDGAALTERASLTLCNNNAGSYYWDRTNNRIYVRSTTATPYLYTMQALVLFAWSNHPREIDGVPYQPRIAGFPSLDLSIPARFTAQAVARGGSLEVEQAQGSTPGAPGLFDGLQGIDWDAGHVIVRFGADAVY
jgi:hypothetical protein